MRESQDLPGFREKRKILFGENTTPEQMLETGRKFMAAGRFDDALEFFQRSDARAEVQQIAQTAAQSGDTALFLRAKLVLGEQASEQELVRVARAAEASGRHSMAYIAYVKAGRQEDAERLRPRLPAPGEPTAESSPHQPRADEEAGAPP